MTATIFIHCNGEIVEKFVIDYNSIDDLRELEAYAMKKYRGQEQFCFDVMIT